MGDEAEIPREQGMPFWISAASYWQPAHYPATAWVGHAPFLFWLIDRLRPTSIVELGTHWGYSCFVAAEALKRLGVPGTVRALDSWQGDDQAGFYGENVYDYVQRTAREDYPGIVELLRGWFSESRPRVEDASVDLLHIDGRHGYDDAVEDYTMWRSTVRDGGVILFHDIGVRDPGYEVWRLWDELRAEHDTFSFTHWHGLGVLAVGDIRVPELQQLFAADEDTAERIRADYERLAGVVSGSFARRKAEAQLRANLASRSWRVTAPLRALSGRLHRG